MKSPKLIGKFGVGLKDALATFDRRGIGVRIKSHHGDISLVKAQKHGFSDVVTLHALVEPPSDPGMKGTDVILSNCPDEEIEQAKNMFLKFTGDVLLEETSYGQVLEKQTDEAVIYINGVKVAQEENFLFSYNITSLSAAIKKALNRERTNVGRSAYSDRVKTILLECLSTAVAGRMVEDLGNFQKGSLKDELKWTDVYVHACKLLNAQQKVIFLTPNERGYAAGIISHARRDGFRILTIPENIRDRLKGQLDYAGNAVRDLNEFIRIWNDSFEFEFVDVSELTARERAIFAYTKAIFGLVGGKPEEVNSVKISETMRMGRPGASEVVGVWEPDEGRIVIKRSQLQDLEDFAGTLLHEAAHAMTDAPDVSEAFESGLTYYLGLTAAKLVKSAPLKSTRNKAAVPPNGSKRHGKKKSNRR